MAKKRNNTKSSCCKASVRCSNSLENDRTIFICNKCFKNCNIILNIPVRKIWNINPVERIVPNKKKKSSTKLTPKELKELHKNEDF
jgi:hypothetical protein